MSKKTFLSNENTILLWEILEECMSNKPKSFHEHILIIFKEKLLPFYENDKTNIPLIDINKKYILMMMQYIQNYKVEKNENPYKSQNKLQNELMTNSEIQNNRLQLFERDLNYRQEEFTNSMNIHKPPVPNFSIKIEDKPIEMDVTIKQMIAQRNYDIDVIKNTELKVSSETWLKPTETSLKKETQETNINNSNILLNNGNTNDRKNIKIYHDIDNEIYKNKIIDLNKHITWKDETSINIFEKLKKIDHITHDENCENSDINEKILIMQNSISYLSNKIIDIDENIKTILQKINKIE